jgi:hypothetical protein
MLDVKKTSKLSTNEYFAKIQSLNRKLLRGGIAFTDNGWEVAEEVHGLAENGSNRRIDK